MASIDHGVPSFWTQANALLRKNITFQRRNAKQTIVLIFFPAFLCGLIVLFQAMVDSELRKPKFQCGCQCVKPKEGDGPCQKMCGPEYSTAKQATACSIRRPTEWPAMLQLPTSKFRARMRRNSCRRGHPCPATFLFTGRDKQTAARLMVWMNSNALLLNLSRLPSSASLDELDVDLISQAYLGSEGKPGFQNYIENAIISNATLSFLRPSCPPGFHMAIKISENKTKGISCTLTENVWRANPSSINRELYSGYQNGNTANQINEFINAYDFSNTNKSNFNVSIWYNSTFIGFADNKRILRVLKPVNMASNAFLRHHTAGERQVHLEFVKEMPKIGSSISLELTSLIGPLFYSWVLQILLPVFMIYLVYDKQHNLRMMMKLHGLRDVTYLVITYCYFLFISSFYMIWSAGFGYLVGLDIFRLNDYDVQMAFYFVYLNLQIALAFLVSNAFSEVRIATVVAYIYVFTSGLLGDSLLKFYIEDTRFPEWQMIALELFPGFSLYRGLYELRQYALSAEYLETRGMTWESLSDKENGMCRVMFIIASEWLIVLCFAYLLEKAIFSGNLVQSLKCNFLRGLTRTSKTLIASENPSSTITIDRELSDLRAERYKIEQLLAEPQDTHPIFCYKLEKTYDGKDGASKKNAVKALSLSVPRGECFGLLGPSGSGKTTFIEVMTGFSLPSSGTAFINNMDIRMATNQIQARIGFCPQHDVIWETLTGREHLLFYGRLRNLKGSALKNAVEDSLKSFNLFKCNVGDRLAGGYSGGMKRRLCVAISLIGHSQVVFLDEPSGSLDLHSRNHLWHVIKKEGLDRAIILTTHSMEEAEFLCDRIGILVNGKLQCLGDPKELKARYGRSLLFTISLDPLHKVKAESMVARLSPNAVKVYDLGETLKFQLPKNDIRICDVFEAVDQFRRETPIYGFGLNESSLEEAFTNVVDEAS